MNASRPASCPGCGARLPAWDGAAPTDADAPAACVALYHELTAETLSDRDPSFPHQLAVDAYAAQHAEAASKPITITFALIGLYLVCERGATGRQAQLAHMRLGRRRQEWPRFHPPAHRGAVTVADVLAAGDVNRKKALHRWARSVWSAWEAEHGRVAALVRDRLDAA